MKGLTRTKKLEVAQYYVLGYSYKQMEDKAKISHGSVANIVEEVESGHLTVPGVGLDQVGDLRTLSIDLKKKGLEPAQALLGISFFKRLNDLGIGPEALTRWSELVKRCAPDDFPAERFFESAVRLHELEEHEGKPFEELAEEHQRLTELNQQLKAQGQSLDKRKRELSEEVQSLSAQAATLAARREAVRKGAGAEEARLKEFRSTAKKAGEEKASLARQIRELENGKTRLRSEVDGKEQSLRRLNELGFSDEDLLRLRRFLEKLAEEEGTDAGDLKRNFFRAFDYFSSLLELQKAAAAEAESIKKMRQEKSSLASEVARLQSTRTVLQGEIRDSVSLASKKIRDASDAAVLQIEQEAERIRSQLKAILADALTTGGVVSGMRAVQKKGEESCRELEAFLQEAKDRVEGH